MKETKQLKHERILTIDGNCLIALSPTVLRPQEPEQMVFHTAAAFFRTARKFRYSISCCFISVRGTMASMRPRSRRNSAV